MKELLQETYGVMVYQEDVIKVAHHFGGLDMAEADILRRAMSGKYRGNSEMLRIREKFFANCKQRGYADSVTREVWRQIESFSGYSFSKAHSASFAVESYQSLYLKTYFPQEFMVAVINNFGGFYSTELYFHELKKTGANVYAPCVNNSGQLTNIRGNNVYTGFVHIQNLDEKWIKKIISERERNGKYLHLHNFIERTAMPIEQLNVLVRVGAFRFTGKDKKDLLWEANFLQKKTRDHVPPGKALFDEAVPAFKLPAFTVRPYDDALDELELLGFPLSNVFDIADEDPYRYTLASQLNTCAGREVTVLAYLITTKTVNTVQREMMQFGTFIDVAGDWIDTIHFPAVDNRYPLQGKGFYKITGKVVEEFDVYSIEVQYMEKVGIRSRAD
jgi:DNA polymerase-3 subunit alpha